jgi:hypothetical protein
MVYDVFDLQNFAVDTFNWNGDNEYFLQEKQTQEHGGRHPHKRPALHLDQTPPPSAWKWKNKVQVEIEVVQANAEKEQLETLLALQMHPAAPFC